MKPITVEYRNGLLHKMDAIQMLQHPGEGHEQDFFLPLGGSRQLKAKKQTQIKLGLRDLDLIDKDLKITTSCMVMWGSKGIKRPFIAKDMFTNNGVLMLFSFAYGKRFDVNERMDVKVFSNSLSSPLIGLNVRDHIVHKQNLPTIECLIKLRPGAIISLYRGGEGVKNSISICGNNNDISLIECNNENLTKIYDNTEDEPSYLNVG